MLVSMRALVIGDSGQDGQLLSAQLKSDGYEVLGISRSRTLVNGVAQEPVDFINPISCHEFLSLYHPEVVFHVAAIHGASHSQDAVISLQSKEMYECHVAITRNVLTWIEAISNMTKFHIALSSQMYSAEYPNFYVDEFTQTNPQNFYGETKVEAWDLVKFFRNEFGLNASASILFNHASSLSRSDFVLSYLARQFFDVITSGKGSIDLRNPFTCVDISSAHEICDAMTSNVKVAPSEDFVLASGINRSLNEIVQKTLPRFNLQESCLSWNPYLHLTQFPERNYLTAVPVKARNMLKWSTTLTPTDILENMILDELKKMNR
jgi:GDPmannose 4,6-dehydratase